MTSRRSVRAGEQIVLRALFRDDLDEFAQASGVNVQIFDSNSSLRETGNATYFDYGIHEYPYTIPHEGPGGSWTDIWQGTLNGQTLSGNFNFFVTNSGNITALGNQLNVNNVVELTIPSGITALDGTVLEEEESFTWMTTIVPGYTNTRKVRLEAGAWLNKVEEDTVQTAILEASLEADVISFTSSNTNNALYKHARREYTTCVAALMLVTNTGSSALRSKTLDDLHVEYDTNAFRNILDKLNACIDRWEAQLISGGASKANRAPKMVVKGEFDPDRPPVGRLWEQVVNRPVANDKIVRAGYRRYQNFYNRRKKYW